MTDEKILCATDLSGEGSRTVDLAVVTAKAFDVGLELLHVIDDADTWWPETPDVESAVKKAEEQRVVYETRMRQKLQAEQDRCAASGVECEGLIVRGRPWRVIPELASQRNALLTVIGAHGADGERSVTKESVAERVLGATADKVVQVSDRPVFVATGTNPIPSTLIGADWLLGTDFSGSCQTALLWAKEATEKTGGRLHVVNVVLPAGRDDRPDEERTWRQILRSESKLEAERRLESWVAEHAPQASSRQLMSYDRTSDALCTAADEVGADVVVLGTSVRSVLGRLLIGSTAHEVLRRCSVPVLLVPVDQQL